MRALTFALALLIALPAGAQDGALVAMQTGDAAKGWQGVGKLVLGERGFCTAALIEPQLVLTAAHCLYDRETGARVPDDLITFRAGWRNGRAEAYRGVRRSVAHPDYVYAGEDRLERVGHDLALLELDQPILLPQLPPFATGFAPAEGAAVSVVSYAMDRAEAPAIERDCAVLAGGSGALVLSCDIDFGSSGAPVFALRDGGAQVVSVISAKAEYGGRKVALAVPVENGLSVLRAELAAGTGAHRTTPGVRVISGGEAAAVASGGARFVSP